MRPTKTNKTIRNAKAIAGTQKHLMNLASIILNGAAFTPAQIIALLQAESDSIVAFDAADGQRKKAVATEKAASAAANPVFVTFRREVVNMFATQPETLADFGFVPPKKRVVSPATQVEAAQKRKATRKARNTMGKKQKAEIKGEVTPPAPAVAAPTPKS